ncbi:NGG1 interacting factor variant 2 [Porites harrisoni]
MELKEVVTKLNFFAPLQLAEKWDNVGLLVEPSPPHSVKSILLTNDLTERVAQEAVDKKVSMVISYHPPIFVPLKRLTSKTFKERIIIKMIENRIALFSPHTAFDAVKNGVNDWLAAGLGSAQVDPLEHSKGQSSGVKLEARMLTNQVPDQITSVQDKLKDLQGVERIEVETLMRPQGLTEQQLSLHCSESGLVDTLQTLTSLLPEALGNVEVVPLAQIPILGTGQGRLCTLHSPVTLSELISRIKNHLNLKHIRLAAANSSTSEDPLQSSVQTIALCAGSGASVLRGIQADVYLTGEMSHHDILDAVSRGVHVILCEHSNTERGFLTEFRGKLVELLEGKVDVMVSSNDADPLQIL